mgnify:CR=1 FL=1
MRSIWRMGSVSLLSNAVRLVAGLITTAVVVNAFPVSAEQRAALAEREADRTESVVESQLRGCLAGLPGPEVGRAVLAYEPVWAIGTGKTATPEQAQEVHAFIRSRIAASDASVAEGVQILYGGSMNAGNASELLAQPDIDGGLIGGASLKADDFLTIARAAN